MLGTAPKRRLAGLALAFSLVFAMPLASAFGMGVDADSVAEMKNAGAQPAYGQVWAGHWMEEHGWGGFEAEMKRVRDGGAIPVIQWYFWGDDISPNCVKYGCAGRTKGEWDAMAREMATRAENIMGSKPFYVVVEPEFQKNGIQDWETFDGYLEDQIKLIRGIAPNAELVVGFGHWGNWEIFDRAVAAADMTGFQVLRGSTRDSTSTTLATADYMIRLSKELKADWGKPVMVFDLGISTYGGWQWVQEKALDNIIAKRGELDAAGVKIIVWRYVYDNSRSSGYFGEAEKYWGVKTASGSKKAGYDELLTLLKGGSTSTSTSTSTSSSTSSGSFDATFSGVKVQEWWVQTSVKGTQSIGKVEARVDGGSWQSLTKQSWGGWAKSFRVHEGQKVEFRATSTSGATDVSDAYTRGGSTTTTSTSGSTGSGSFDASFSGVKVLDWWVQTTVKGDDPIAKVEVRVNGGSWQTLTKQSWGGYAKSFRIYDGQKVEFRATSTSGATDISGAYYR